MPSARDYQLFIVLSKQKLIISVSEMFNDLRFYCISKCNMKRQLMSDFIYKARALPFVFERIYFPAYILVKVFHYFKNNNIFLKRDQQWKSKFSECLKELQMKLQIGNESRVWLKMAICWCIEQIYIFYRHGQRPHCGIWK